MSVYQRDIKLLKQKSFFLFGARGTGKSTLLRKEFSEDSTLWLDLLDPKLEERLVDRPGDLAGLIAAHRPTPEWVIIDEVQKSPKLLDVVHQQIESCELKFALTGSSARKLKRGGSNLLAGRALMNTLFPLTHTEIGADFNLQDILHWGSLPSVVTENDPMLREEYLHAYVQGYLKEEILQEQNTQKLSTTSEKKSILF